MAILPFVPLVGQFSKLDTPAPFLRTDFVQGSGLGANAFLEFVKGDQVDRVVDYLSFGTEDKMRFHRAQFTDFFYKNVAPLSLPAGKIVELGVYKGEFYNHLEKVYGKDRCVGLDVYNYRGINDLIVKDVRDLTEKDDFEIALGRNHVCTWNDSFASRLAALRFLVRNLVFDGLLLEAGLEDIPSNIKIFGMQKIGNFKGVTLLKKTSRDAFVVQS